MIEYFSDNTYSNNKNLVPIVGIHTSGKTTLLSTLKDYGMVTEEEIAEKIRREQGVKAGASGDILFEYMIKQEEMVRDKSRDWQTTNLIFVESWHILTIAYMLTRGLIKSEVSTYKNYIKEVSNEINVFCIFLMSDPSLICQRSSKLHSEKDIFEYQDFYLRLQENIIWILKDIQIKYRVFDSKQPFERIKNDILNCLYLEFGVKSLKVKEIQI